MRLVVTFDQFQSTDSRQTLLREGIQTGYQSVDKDEEAYTILKELIYTRRLLSPGSVRIVKEIIGLVKIPGNKIDHPAGGSKDLSDALAGAVKTLYDVWYNPDEQMSTLVYEDRVPIGDDYLGSNNLLPE